MIAIIGKSGVGKSTLAKFLQQDHGLRVGGTSTYAFNNVIYSGLAYCYTSKQQCLMNKENDRHLWSALISQYNHKDKGRLVKEMLEHYDVIEGIRKQEELDAVRDKFALIIGLVRVGYNLLDPTFDIEIVRSSDIVFFSESVEDLKNLSKSMKI